MTLQLLRLDCPSCGSAMRGEPFDILFVCDHCGAGQVLGGAGLETVECSALLPAPGRQTAVWRPGWRVEADVTVRARITAGGRQSQDARTRRTFVIPAFDLPLASLTRLARALGAAAAAAAEVPHEAVRGGILALDDALTMIRHLVIGEEVRRPDMLASVQVTIDPLARRLVALPFEQTNEGLRCAVTGVVVPRAR